MENWSYTKSNGWQSSRFNYRPFKQKVKNVSLLKRHKSSSYSRVKKPRRYVKLPPIQRNDFDNPDNEPLENPNGPVYTLNDIFANTRQAKKSIEQRNKKSARFINWINVQRQQGLYFPSWQNIRADYNVQRRFCNKVATYLQYVFNITYNLGNSLAADLEAVKYVAALNGVYVNNNDFKWWPRFKRGCNEISRHAFGKPPGERKRALFNPMIEDMLKAAQNDSVIKLAVLLAHRLCLRAQHYVKTEAQEVDIMTYGSLSFDKDIEGNVISMTYRNHTDKNHPVGSHPMDRTVYCTCHTEWTCLPCFACEFVEFNMEYGAKEESDYLIAYQYEVLDYQEWLSIFKVLIVQSGLDPELYGTHSLRAGGTSERDILGDTPHELQVFGWWKSVNSVFAYIRLGNPDIRKYWVNLDKYTEYRRAQESVTTARLNRQRAAMFSYSNSRHRK